MIDFRLIAGFDWDEGNGRKSEDKHSVSKDEAEQIFFNQPLLIIEDTAHSLVETRLHALGVTDNARLLHVIFTLPQQGTKIRVISARDMHRKERRVYEQSPE